MDAQIQIINDDSIVIISAERPLLALLAKGGSQPAGALLEVLTPSGVSHWYGKTPPNSVSTYGCQILAADGVTVLFDALAYGKLGKPVGVITGTLGNDPGGGGGTQTIVTKTFPIPAGKTYGVALHKQPSAHRVRNVEVIVGGSTSYTYALDEQVVEASFSSTLVTVTATRTNGNPGFGSTSTPYTGTGNDPTFRAVVLDITNY